jgi:ubiquinone/menaquinone biosynthesis C-methylase UbiE
MVINILPLILLSFSLLAVAFLLDVFLTGKTPLVTTPFESRKKIIKILELKESSVFYDLGCGTGSLLIECSKAFPSSGFVGIDNSPFSYILSRLRTRLNKPNNIYIKFGNFFDHDLSGATHIFLWIFVKDMDKLLKKFKSELKPGTPVYSLDFKFSEKIPEKTIDLGRENKFGHTLYIYRF